MRIISGKFKGRRFYPPADKWPTRPTTDFAKEGLYNILQNRIEFSGIRMLDLFGGTGSHSLECISRGCTDVTYVDRHAPCARFVRELAESLGVGDLIDVHRDDVLRFCRQRPGSYDYIFAGPPYAMKQIADFPGLIFDNELLAEGGIFVLETDQHYNFEELPRFLEVRRYGQCHFHFFR